MSKTDRLLTDEEIDNISMPFGCESTCQNFDGGCDDCVKRMVAQAQLAKDEARHKAELERIKGEIEDKE